MHLWYFGMGQNVGCTSVSYTHLDLYKRQPAWASDTGKSAMTNQSKSCLPFMGRRLLLLVSSDAFWPERGGSCPFRHDLGPVSYTHLDVYKRQSIPIKSQMVIHGQILTTKYFCFLKQMYMEQHLVLRMNPQKWMIIRWESKESLCQRAWKLRTGNGGYAHQIKAFPAVEL